jgi:NAD(P)-binding Rossmann-like domain
MMNSCEFMQVLLDCVTSGQVGARDILTSVSAAGLASGLSVPTVQQALTAGETQTLNQAKAKRAYDYIFIGSGASGSIIAGELSKTGADVLVVESGGDDSGTAISNPSICFYKCWRSARLDAADRAGSSVEQPPIQHGARACPRWRQLRQRNGVDGPGCDLTT